MQEMKILVLAIIIIIIIKAKTFMVNKLLLLVKINRKTIIKVDQLSKISMLESLHLPKILIKIRIKIRVHLLFKMNLGWALMIIENHPLEIIINSNHLRDQTILILVNK